MATTPTTIAKSARGIVRTLDGFILQNETITTSPIVEQTPDQMGAIADEEAGTYNSLLRFNIRAHRYDNFPAAQ